MAGYASSRAASNQARRRGLVGGAEGCTLSLLYTHSVSPFLLPPPRLDHSALTMHQDQSASLPRQGISTIIVFAHPPLLTGIRRKDTALSLRCRLTCTLSSVTTQVPDICPCPVTGLKHASLCSHKTFREMF